MDDSIQNLAAEFETEFDDKLTKLVSILLIIIHHIIYYTNLVGNEKN